MNSAAPPSLFGITATQRRSAIIIKAKIGSEPEFNLIFDTGSPFTLVGKQTFDRVAGDMPLEPCQEKLRGVGGSEVKVFGTTRIPLELTIGKVKRQKHMDVIVIAFNHPEAQGLMGRDAMEIFEIGISPQGKLITKGNEQDVEIMLIAEPPDTALRNLINTTAQPTLQGLIRDNTHLFCEDLTDLRMGARTVAPKVYLKNDRPVYRAPYPIPQKHEEVVKRKIKEMMQAGIIEPSTSNYNAPLYPVVKSNGDIRITLDLRGINEETIKNQYQMPRIDRCLAALAGARFFSSLDLSNGYFQIKNRPEDNELWAFTLPFGRFQLTRMPQGGKNSPMAFQRIMHETLGDLVGNGVEVFLDDLIIYSKTEEKHTQLVREVFRKLNANNMKLKPSKCKFLVDRVNFLGHQVTAEGISPNKSNLSAIQQAPTPTSCRKTRQFLGVINFFRPFIPKAAKLLAPLFDLQKKGRKFNWTSECEIAFTQAKRILTQAPVLAHPNYDEPFILFTDACDSAVGAYLAQKQPDNTLKPTGFFSKRLVGAPTRYSTIERELYAVLLAARHFRYYLIGRETQVFSDHKPITYNKGAAYRNLRLARWSEEMEEYCFKWSHIKGEANIIADYLSRNPEEGTGVQLVTDDTFLKELEEEPVWGRIIKSLKRKPNQLGKYRMTNDHLLQIDSTGKERMVVPRSKVRGIVRHYHESPLTGHSNSEDTKARITERFVWKRMGRDIKRIIQTCRNCQKANAVITRAPHLTYKPPTEPFQMISIDLMGPFPPTRLGNAYIFVCVDLMTRFPIIAPMETSSAEETAKVLLDQVICTYGTPKFLLTDRGTNFTSLLFQRLCGLLGTKHLGTTAFRPQANGHVERLNRSIQEIIRKLASEEEWDQILPKASFAIRTHKHSSTGVSPSKALYDFEPRIPPPVKEINSSECLTTLQQRAEEVATTHIRAFSDTRKLITDKLEALFKKKSEEVENGKIRTFQPGDAVWIKIMPQRSGPSKFLPRMKGPGKVRRRLGPVSYEVEMEGKVDTIHVDRLKNCINPKIDEEPLIPDEPREEDESEDGDIIWYQPQELQENRPEVEVIPKSEERIYGDKILRPRDKLHRPARYC